MCQQDKVSIGWQHKIVTDYPDISLIVTDIHKKILTHDLLR